MMQLDFLAEKIIPGINIEFFKVKWLADVQ